MAVYAERIRMSAMRVAMEARVTVAIWLVFSYFGNQIID